MKEDVRKRLRDLRKGREDRKSYKRKRKEYKILCEKKRNEQKELIKKVEVARTEKDIWAVVNKRRKRRERVGAEITMKEWTNYFMGIMGGVEKKVIRGIRKGREKHEEEEIEKNEVRRAIRKIKDQKTMGNVRDTGGGLEVRRTGFKKFVIGYEEGKDGQNSGRKE